MNKPSKRTKPLRESVRDRSLLKGIVESVRIGSGYCWGLDFFFNQFSVVFGFSIWLLWGFFSVFFFQMPPDIPAGITPACKTNFLLVSYLAQQSSPAPLQLGSGTRRLAERDSHMESEEELLLTPVINTVWKRKLNLCLPYE